MPYLKLLLDAKPSMVCMAHDRSSQKSGSLPADGLRSGCNETSVDLSLVLLIGNWVPSRCVDPSRSASHPPIRTLPFRSCTTRLLSNVECIVCHVKHLHASGGHHLHDIVTSPSDDAVLEALLGLLRQVMRHALSQKTPGNYP